MSLNDHALHAKPLKGPELATPQFLSGGGAMGALMRTVDWSKTPIGPIETWSPSLRMMVSFLLANRFPLLLWWGPEFCQLYNDAYRPVLGTKHPQSMGQSAHECWPEIWHVIGPLIATPFNGGPATWMDDICLEVNRKGFVEETHFTIAYSPVPDETAPRGIGGVLATVHEITEKVIGERRVAALRDLGARTGEAKTAQEACAMAAAMLASHTKDIPFALLYLIDPDGQHARLAGTAGLAMGETASPLVIALGQNQEPDLGWPLGAALVREAMITVEDIGSRFDRVPAGPWSDPPRCAVVVPIRSNAANRLAGLLVAGVSSRLMLDDQYRAFLELAAAQIATAIATARAYEEERKRAEALAEIDRAKTAFFSNVSHEFRTPLTLMLGPLEEALASSSDAAPLHINDVALIHRNGLRLLRLVNTLLDFSRIEAGRVQASYEPVDLAAFTAELASVFRAATDKAGLRLTVDCPPLDEPVWVDPEMWEKIVLNLVSNAFKFTFEGGITVRVRPEAAQAVLTVSDTGMGVAEAEIPRLFDRFHRVEAAQGRTHEGTGIGLALVQELVKLHGGTVGVDSVLGRGTNFTVSLPRGTAHLPPDRLRAKRKLTSTALGAQPFLEEALRWLPVDHGAAAPEGSIMPEEAPSTGFGPATERPRILLADDNADMRDYLRRVLSARYEVRAVSDGEAAFTALRAELPDLLLSDIMMPRRDGYELLRAIRGDSTLADLPVILLSARAGEEASIEGLQAGADDYLVKPFSARELLARVAANLKMAQLRRNAREALAASGQRLRFMAEAMPQKIFTTDPNGRIDYFNQQWVVFSGLSFDRLYTEGWTQLIHPADLTGSTVAWRDSVATGEAFQATHRLRRHDGTYRWHLSRAHAMRNGAGNISMWIGSSTEIHEQKETEEAYRVLSDALERKVEERSSALEAEMAERQKIEAALQRAQRLEAIGQLTGGIAHDFNNLLTVVIGQTEAIMTAAAGDERIMHMAAAAQSVAERGARLTNQLLAFSRRQHLRPETLVVGALMPTLGDLMRRAIGEAITVEINLSPQLWPSRLDPTQFESALLNLAINARDAMPEGGRLTITMQNAVVTAAEARHLDLASGDYVVVSVSDNGCGMPPEVQQRCFEPFFTTKEIGKGTGLGLSQVYGFARQSGGTVAVDSTLGEGTTIRLYLPRALNELSADTASAQPTIAMSVHGKTVLLVEDQEEVREIIELSLGELGYRVRVAADGPAARKVLESTEPIDLLLTDIVMPNGVSGVALARWARKLRQDLKIVLMSGYSPVQPQSGDENFAFLKKPFRQAELATTIGTVLYGERAAASD